MDVPLVGVVGSNSSNRGGEELGSQYVSVVLTFGRFGAHCSFPRRGLGPK